METTDPCYPQKWFSVYFLLFQTSRKKQSRTHGRCPVGSDLFSSRGTAEQCKEGLNHPRGASLSRGFVSPMPAIGFSSDLGVTAWKTLLSRSKSIWESISRLINFKSSLIPSKEQEVCLRAGSHVNVHGVWGHKPVLCFFSGSNHPTMCLGRRGTGKI